MSGMTLLLIAAGGALGSVARALVAWVIPAGRMPWGTIVVNILGCFVIGWLLVKLGVGAERDMRGHNFAVVGFCGGFTTFSSFSVQALEQMLKGDWPAAAANIFGSLIFCLVATWLGWRLAR
jgi:CrcB protein